MTAQSDAHYCETGRGARKAAGSLSRSCRTLALAVLLASIPGLHGCGGEGGSGAGDADSLAADSTQLAEQADKPKKKEKSSSINAARVFRGDLVLPITAEGSIRARHSTEIRSEISGRITSLQCREGQRIREGQLLAQLDGRDYQVALDDARSAYLQSLSQLAVESEADEDWAENPAGNLDQLGDLEGDLQQQLASLREGDYRLEIKAGRTGLAAALAAERRARLNLERCEIRAPFDGVISGLRLSRGEWVSAGQNLFTLIDDVNLEAAVDVLESDMVHLQADRPVLLAIPALADTLMMQVDIISPQLDSSSRSCQVLMRFRDESERVKPGMFVRAAIAGEILPDRLLVPREAVLTRDNRPLVFKVADGISQWLYLTLGERNDSFVEVKRVLQGGTLAPGDQVVVSDHLTLTHGAKVKIKNLSEPSNPWDSAGGAGK